MIHIDEYNYIYNKSKRAEDRRKPSHRQFSGVASLEKGRFCYDRPYLRKATLEEYRREGLIKTIHHSLLTINL